MNAQTTVSAKGQVVIPKDVRDRLRLATGDRLEVIERPDGILLRKPHQGVSEPFDVIAARIRERVRYHGPALAIDDMDRAIDAMWASTGPVWDR